MTPADTWFSPHRIDFKWHEIIFLLEHYWELSKGEWPKKPENTGYNDTPLRRRRYRREAYFCTPIEIKAELDVRLKAAGEWSSILWDIHVLGYSEEEAAMERRITTDTLRRRKNAVMCLITGHKRPKTQIHTLHSFSDTKLGI